MRQSLVSPQIHLYGSNSIETCCPCVGGGSMPLAFIFAFRGVHRLKKRVVIFVT